MEPLPEEAYNGTNEFWLGFHISLFILSLTLRHGAYVKTMWLGKVTPSTGPVWVWNAEVEESFSSFSTEHIYSFCN